MVAKRDWRCVRDDLGAMGAIEAVLFVRLIWGLARGYEHDYSLSFSKLVRKS
jgi:hypothetical protein